MFANCYVLVVSCKVSIANVDFHYRELVLFSLRKMFLIEKRVLTLHCIYKDISKEFVSLCLRSRHIQFVFAVVFFYPFLFVYDLLS